MAAMSNGRGKTGKSSDFDPISRNGRRYSRRSTSSSTTGLRTSAALTNATHVLPMGLRASQLPRYPQLPPVWIGRSVWGSTANQAPASNSRLRRSKPSGRTIKIDVSALVLTIAALGEAAARNICCEVHHGGKATATTSARLRGGAGAAGRPPAGPRTDSGGCRSPSR